METSHEDDVVTVAGNVSEVKGVGHKEPLTAWVLPLMPRDVGEEDVGFELGVVGAVKGMRILCLQWMQGFS